MAHETCKSYLITEPLAEVLFRHLEIATKDIPKSARALESVDHCACG